MSVRTLRGPILNPAAEDDRVDYWPDGVIVHDGRTIIAAGPWALIEPQLPKDRPPTERANGIVCPPFLDAHIHIPQHPIRGHFTDGVDENDPSGRLLGGLNRNVFPAEGRFENRQYAQQVTRHFLEDTLAHGVVGGAAYATVHPDAAEDALDILAAYAPFWSVGMVLMNQNCPEYLRTPEFALARLGSMAMRFGRRCIVTDRFAVAVDSTLRTLAMAEAERFGLRSQTHLNEQRAEKRLVEDALYPTAGSYTNVYLLDGLLDHDAILAHCIHMSDAELQTVATKRATIAHCPTSNTLLGSGVMPLDRVTAHGIDWAICTDVGASPTTSVLAEMAQFLKVHAGRSARATPSMALWRSTAGPARVLAVSAAIGRFAKGMQLSYVEIDPGDARLDGSADEVIASALLDGRVKPAEMHAIDKLEREGLGASLELSLLTDDITQTATALDSKALSVHLAGRPVWRRAQV